MQYAKQDRNMLKDENIRLATRVKFLEGQLLIKDKIFQDLYKAAFQYNGQMVQTNINLGPIQQRSATVNKGDGKRDGSVVKKMKK